mmetsp:Transcript_14764/g.47186  ORF Transcript_14764/g.47186 Transcript_14764/m.47186 type:complete len:211 (-) Transcript_14764:188-820(-)
MRRTLAGNLAEGQFGQLLDFGSPPSPVVSSPHCGNAGPQFQHSFPPERLPMVGLRLPGGEPPARSAPSLRGCRPGHDLHRSSSVKESAVRHHGHSGVGRPFPLTRSADGGAAAGGRRCGVGFQRALAQAPRSSLRGRRHRARALRGRSEGLRRCSRSAARKEDRSHGSAHTRVRPHAQGLLPAPEVKSCAGSGGEGQAGKDAAGGRVPAG